MKIIVANVDSNAKSNKFIDSKMKRRLSQLKFTGSYIGKYELISTDLEERIYERVKGLLNRFVTQYTSKNHLTQTSKILLKYYTGIKYIVIMINKEKIKVNLLYDTGINLSNNQFVNLIENKLTGKIDITMQYF